MHFCPRLVRPVLNIAKPSLCPPHPSVEGGGVGGGAFAIDWCVPAVGLCATECLVGKRVDELVMKAKPQEPLQSIIYVLVIEEEDEQIVTKEKSEEREEVVLEASGAWRMKWKWGIKWRNRDVYTSVIYPCSVSNITSPFSLMSLFHIKQFVMVTLVCEFAQFLPWSPATPTLPWQGRARSRSWTAQHGASSPSLSAGREGTQSLTRRETPVTPSASTRRGMKSSPP